MATAAQELTAFAVGLRFGTWLEACQECQRGGPESPVPSAEIVKKFRENARRVLPDDQAERLEAAALGIETAGDVGLLLTLCRVD